MTMLGVKFCFLHCLQGWVPLGQLSSEPIEFPEKVFYKGQVVKCRVVNYDPDQQKLRLSFRVTVSEKWLHLVLDSFFYVQIFSIIVDIV